MYLLEQHSQQLAERSRSETSPAGRASESLPLIPPDARSPAGLSRRYFGVTPHQNGSVGTEIHTGLSRRRKKNCGQGHEAPANHFKNYQGNLLQRYVSNRISPEVRAARQIPGGRNDPTTHQPIEGLPACAAWITRHHSPKNSRGTTYLMKQLRTAAKETR